MELACGVGELPSFRARHAGEAIPGIPRPVGVNCFAARILPDHHYLLQSRYLFAAEAAGLFGAGADQ